MSRRRGFVLVMWTGCLENPRTGQPFVFRSPTTAAKALARYPSWGHAVVSLRRVRTRPGGNGKRDFIIGETVALTPGIF